MLLSLMSLWQQPYHRSLLDTARRLAQEGHHEIAVVTAQMACEVYTEGLMITLLRAKDLSYLERPLSDLLPSYNLSNEKVRSLYGSLSADPIQDRPFWPRFKDLARSRNDAVHRGARITKEQALAACDTADEMLTHLEGIIQAVRR